MSKRKLLQLHLSTALVLMVLAGGLFFLNVREVETHGHEEADAPYGLTNEYLKSEWTKKSRGWPLYFYFRWSLRNFTGEMAYPQFPSGFYLKTDRNGIVLQKNRHLVYNILIALAILSVVGAGFEWWVRRREKQRGQL